MKVHYGFDGLRFRSPVVTLGAFDGVHTGHRAIFNKVRENSKQINGESVVITFDPHPRKVLSYNNGPILFLSTLREKIAQISKCGIDHLVVAGFDDNLSNKEACDFITEILVSKIGARKLIMGYNQHFGRRGEGDFRTISDCASIHGMEVGLADEVKMNSGSISSSAIREALLDGRLEEANAMLGYCYSLTGTIVEGRKLGRKIGYPTANINPEHTEKLIPKDGVYAVEVKTGRRKYKGMMSIGLNPTIDINSSERSIEVNIFHFRKEIYGEEVKVIFRFRLRDEVTFKNLDELARQIEADKAMAISLLG